MPNWAGRFRVADHPGRRHGGQWRAPQYPRM